jgi:phosphoglycerate dehydrogenase-like enzyme
VKAVLQYRASPGFVERLEGESPDWLEIVVVDETDLDQFATEMVDAEALFHVLEPVTAEVMDGAPNLRLVQKIGVGVNTIDLDAARERGIAVANMPGTNSRAVAEMTILLMLAALRRVPYFHQLTRDGEGWNADLEALDQLGELSGRTVGLVGYGATARMVAPILVAMGAEVLYTARTAKPDAVGDWMEFDELLGASDVVSLHLPLTPDTERLIDESRLAMMRPGAVLINTSRGQLLDEPAVADALRSGQLRAAGLDVFTSEPIDDDSPFLQLDNVVVQPHLAWLTPETLDRSMVVAIENCRRVRDGDPLVHQVV